MDCFFLVAMTRSSRRFPCPSSIHPSLSGSSPFFFFANRPFINGQKDTPFLTMSSHSCRSICTYRIYPSFNRIGRFISSIANAKRTYLGPSFLRCTIAACWRWRLSLRRTPHPCCSPSSPFPPFLFS